MKSDSHGFFSGENISIVDETLESLQSLSATLSENEYTVQSAISGAMASIVAQSNPPDLIVLDIKTSKIDGYKVCKKLKESTKTSDIPIISLSRLYYISENIKAFKVGNPDYITKLFQIEELFTIVKHQITIQRLTR
ncbi:MAG: response regulator [Cyanobacteriota bacterium]|nr:response regulator [Cyanobacteriota bacterium]